MNNEPSKIPAIVLYMEILKTGIHMVSVYYEVQVRILENNLTRRSDVKLSHRLRMLGNGCIIENTELSAQTWNLAGQVWGLYRRQNFTRNEMYHFLRNPLLESVGDFQKGNPGKVEKPLNGLVADEAFLRWYLKKSKHKRRSVDCQKCVILFIGGSVPESSINLSEFRYFRSN